MKFFINKKTERVYFYAPAHFNTNNIAYWVKWIRDNHNADCDVFMSQSQYNAIESNDIDAGFFALINAGLYVVNS